ncbi:MAG: hypothetical protein OXH83_23375 [Bryobacterales bacterium]|nr:hypothetical protein [Bryobacterales bacterium]
MRHLSPEELLLYANSELEDRGLRRHVAECVDCKSRLVDMQESFVLTAAAIREALPAPAPQPEQFAALRKRLAAEAQLLSLHLSTEDLLLSIENSLSPELEAHLATCAQCQARAADLHVQLASIEYELSRESAFELPLDHKAAALATLRGRLEQEVESHRSANTRIWQWMPQIRPFQVPALTPYAAAFAGVCLAAWLGWNAIGTPELPAPAITAQLVETALPPATLSAEAPQAADLEVAAQATPPERFQWIAAAPRQAAPASMQALIAGAAPDVSAGTVPSHLAVVALPRLDDLPEPLAPSPTALAEAAPEAESAAPTTVRADPEVLAEGSWMLIKAGLWKASLEASGTAESIRFAGTVASERERARAEKALLAVADGRPIEFDIAVRGARVPADAVPDAVRASRTRSLGTTVRNALLQHYRDAARRSFQPLDRSMLENELDLYVSDVMRHDADLLAHVHALHNLLSRTGITEIRDGDSFRRAARYHLDGIARHEASIHGQLSEALPRRYWAYRGPRVTDSNSSDLQAAGTALLQDALALDQALSSLFFGGSDVLDISEGSLSSASLLARLRQRTRQLRSAIR